MWSQESGPPVVAVLNSNDDTVEMLRVMLESEGMLTVSAHLADIKRGNFDFGGFLKEHDPKVVLVDLAPPYDRTWLMLQHLRNVPAARGRSFVLTSTNPARVQEIANPDQEVLEIIGKPYDIRAIVDKVREAIRT